MKRVYWNYEVGDQVLLYAKTLTTKVVFAVFKTKQRQRFIVTFAVIAKKGLSYTLNLQCKLRTVPLFYFLPTPIDVEVLAPRVLPLPRAVASVPGGPVAPPSEVA